MRAKSHYIALSALIVAVGSFAFAGLTGAKKTNVNGIDWYATFDDAKARAKQTGKPILLLSMFGHLDEKMPCANARTLRATLFNDPEFKRFANEEAIVAWEMVREVPKVTIDFGNGNKLERTVRGNAVMYLCNSDGKVIDAYPGIYTASDFFPMVRESIEKLNSSSTERVLAWHEGLAKLPRSFAATVSKAASESPTLDLIGTPLFAGAKTDEQPADPKRIRFFLAAARTSDLSLAPMRASLVSSRVIGQPDANRTPEQIGKEIMERDSQQNVTFMRSIIHCWIASLKELPTPEQARNDVLETILKIPYKDPYMGLNEIAIPGTPTK